MFNDQTTAAPTADPDSFAGASGTLSTTQLEQLAVLSQAPISFEDDATEQVDGAENAAEAAAPLTIGALALQYVRMLALFAGVGMVTAAVRHFSASPRLYLGLGAGGAVLFAVASTVLEPKARRSGIAGLATFAAASLLLGLGLGLTVGGIVHFTAFPHSGAALIPAGLLLSLVGYVGRNGRELIGRQLLPTLVTAVGLLVWIGIGLGAAAKRLDPPPVPGAPADHGGAAAGGHDAASGGEHAAEGAGDHGAAADSEHAAEGEHAAEAGAAAEGEHAAEGGHAAEAGAAAEGGHAAEGGAAAEGAHAAGGDHAAEGGAAAEGDHSAEAAGH
jgi:hypothetical protein